MARPLMALTGLLLLCTSGGCSGGYGPGPETNDGGRGNGIDGLALDAWRTISDAHSTDSACSGMGMQCGAVSATVHAIDGTCTYPLPCQLLGADRLHVYAGGVELPQDGSNGWGWADAYQAVAINGPLCMDVLNGTPVDLMISSFCGPVP